MRKQLLLAGVLMGSCTAFAQSYINAPMKQGVSSVTAPLIKKNQKGTEILAEMVTTPNPYVMPKSNGFDIGYQIGTTFYDLQTNSSVRTATYAFSDNTVAGAFTFGNAAPSYADRGTGYNYMDASSNWGTFGSVREEATVRTGWPSVGFAGGKEWIASHQGGGTVHMLGRATKGSGAWSTDADLPLKGLWPRMATSGNYIHLITAGDPDLNPVSGLDGPIYYHRSSDGGVTWDIVDQIIPDLSSATNNGWGADSYTIDANGSTVAILIADNYNPTFIVKSTDNGTTWTRTNIIDPGLGIYSTTAAGSISDLNSDGVADTIAGSDNSGFVLIDNNDVVHVWFGLMRYLDDDPAADAASSFFPGTNGLAYWKDTNPAVIDTITGALDTDGSGVFLDDYVAQTNIPLYYQSLSSWPSAGIDASGNIYLAYSAIMEELNDQNDPFQFYRHIYIMKSTDGGATWSAPYHIPTQFEYGEYVFPMIARNVTSVIHLTCQRDGNPGLSVRGDEDAADNNEILYFQIPSSLPADLGTEDINVNALLNVFPNPASNLINLNMNTTFVGDAQVQIIDITGKVIVMENINVINGTNTKSFDISSLKSGVYSLNVTVDGKIHSNKFVKH